MVCKYSVFPKLIFNLRVFNQHINHFIDPKILSPGPNSNTVINTLTSIVLKFCYLHPAKERSCFAEYSGILNRKLSSSFDWRMALYIVRNRKQIREFRVLWRKKMVDNVDCLFCIEGFSNLNIYSNCTMCNERAQQG